MYPPTTLRYITSYSIMSSIPLPTYNPSKSQGCFGAIHGIVSQLRELPGSAVVRTLCFHCCGPRLNPWSGISDSTSCAVWPKKETNWRDNTLLMWHLRLLLYYICPKIYIISHLWNLDVSYNQWQYYSLICSVFFLSFKLDDLYWSILFTNPLLYGANTF